MEEATFCTPIARTSIMGRPSLFTAEIAETICRRLGEGETLKGICRDPEMPALATVHGWLVRHKDFSDKYLTARKVQTHTLIDETVEIANTPMMGTVTTVGPKGTETRTADMIEHRRLQVHARQWFAARVNPKDYGDKVQTELTGTLSLEQVILQSMGELSAAAKVIEHQSAETPTLPSADDAGQ